LSLAAVSDLLKPFHARLRRCYPIGTRIKAVSDEALIDLDDYTAMLIAKRR